MIFLIEYDRNKGRMVDLKCFAQSDRSKAENLRFEIELDRNRKGIEREIVLLEAASEQALHATHRRYFEDVRQLTTSGSAVIKRINQ